MYSLHTKGKKVEKASFTLDETKKAQMEGRCVAVLCP
jgi:hypothetical protein